MTRPRFNMELSERLDMEVGHLSEVLDTSKSGVFRLALSLLLVLVQRLAGGNRLYIGKDRNNAMELVIPDLVSLRSVDPQNDESPR